MENKTIEVLISTMNRDNLKFIENMNIQTDFVVGNQNGLNQTIEITVNGHHCLLINSDQTGLSKNRNLTIQNASAGICLLADDDITYCEGYKEIVLRAFEKHEDADVILFNLHETPTKRYVIRKEHIVKGLEFLKYGSVRIAFKRESINAKVSFDEQFGSGSMIPIGEDTIFLSDCLKKGLRIVAMPDFILSLQPSESTWFRGYDERYFVNKGKMYYRIFGSLYLIISIQDAYRHRDRYGKACKWTTNVRCMIRGAREYKLANRG